MNKKVCRSLWVMLSAIVSMAGSASAQTWTSIPMTVVAQQGTESLNENAPYALGWPTAAAPSKRRYLSSSSAGGPITQETSLKGFRIRGYAIAIGSGTDDYDQVDAGFTTSSTFTGTEYGLVVYLPDGLLRLYQCLNCNTVNQLWSETVVFNTPQDAYWYEVTVNSSTGDFTVTVVDPISSQTVTTANVSKQSWMPNVYNMSGYLQITANRGVSGGSWPASVLHVDEIDILQ